VSLVHWHRNRNSGIRAFTVMLCSPSCRAIASAALAQAMAKEYAEDGIHVGHVIVDGAIASDKIFRVPFLGSVNPSPLGDGMHSIR
jgi:hypothetical protein